MIDREEAIRRAKDAGFHESVFGGHFSLEPDDIFNLITRAMNEAYEESAQAAIKCASCTYVTEFDRGVNKGALDAYEAIRALKQEPTK